MPLTGSGTAPCPGPGLPMSQARPDCPWTLWEDLRTSRLSVDNPLATSSDPGNMIGFTGPLDEYGPLLPWQICRRKPYKADAGVGGAAPTLSTSLPGRKGLSTLPFFWVYQPVPSSGTSASGRDSSNYKGATPSQAEPICFTGDSELCLHSQNIPARELVTTGYLAHLDMTS